MKKRINMSEKQDLFTSVNLFIVLFVYVLILFLGTGCKTCQPIIQTEYRDSIRTQFKHDSVFVKEKDSVFVMLKGDTVYRERYSIRYRDRIVTQRDTCFVEREVKVTEREQVIPAYYRKIHVCFWVIVVLIVLYIAIKLYLRFKP
jgi:hypothetical protein